jgi:hypothetical protein
MLSCCGTHGSLLFLAYWANPSLPLTKNFSCKPQGAYPILNEGGIKEALAGKLLISILTGITIAQLSAWVLPNTTVVRAMPNVACRVRLCL